MAVLSGPWAHLVLFLQQAVTLTNRDRDIFLLLLLFGFLLFLSVCLLLLQLVIYFGWKLRQAERDLSRLEQDRRSFGSHFYF